MSWPLFDVSRDPMRWIAPLVIFAAPAALALADDAGSFALLQSAIESRGEQLQSCSFSVQRTYGPDSGLLRAVKADLAFRKAFAKVAGIPIDFDQKASSIEVDIKDSVESWHVVCADGRMLYYTHADKAASTDEWTYRELFTGEHWERFERARGDGPRVVVSTVSVAPPMLSALGLQLPQGVSDVHMLTSDFVGRIGSDWKLESADLQVSEGDQVLVVRASLEKDPSDSQARLFKGEWNLSKGCAPVRMQFEFATVRGGEVRPLRATQGVTVEWAEYEMLETNAWVARTMTRRAFRDVHILDSTQGFHFIERDGQMVKDRDGYPLPDVDRYPVQRFMVEHDVWAMSDYRINDENESLFETSYDRGTIVQNELGAGVQVYQLTGTSPALTTEMRRMLEPGGGLPLRKTPWGKTLWLAVLNVVLLTLIVGVVFWRRWRRGDGAS